MRNLFMILIAGILTVSVPAGHAKAGAPTFAECKIGVCVVKISVVEVKGEKRVVSVPSILLVARRGNNGARKPVNIRFELNTAGFNFIADGIVFSNPVGQFIQIEATPNKIVMIDLNSDLPKLTAYEYTIRVEDGNGVELKLDPVIINGGGGIN